MTDSNDQPLKHQLDPDTTIFISLEVPSTPTSPPIDPVAVATSNSSQTIRTTTSFHATSMTNPTLFVRDRKARYEDFLSFSKHISKDAERFLKSIKNIPKAQHDSADRQLLESAREKLAQSVDVWFDDHESQFTKW